MKKFAAIVSIALALGLSGCTNWERATYQTLAASQATINKAQADYEAKVFPQTTAAYSAINTAKNAQTTAVNAFVAYEEAKTAGGTTASLAALQTDVTVALQNLPTIIADLKALYTGAK